MRSAIRVLGASIPLLGFVNGLGQSGVQEGPGLTPVAVAPVPLRKGDRLVIIGDSITEQKQYSRFIESYLLMCRPDLAVDVRQLGWSGETAGGFLQRIKFDCLQFKPTVATTCYGMNDHGYRAYDNALGDAYRDNTTKIVEQLQAAGARVIVGSPGITGKIPSWVQGAKTSVEGMNASLLHFRNIALGVAEAKRAGFADVYSAMVASQTAGQARHGDAFQVAGEDGVHPGGVGHIAMAYAFLRGMGFAGKELARFELDLSGRKARVTPGHQVLGFDGRTLRVISRQYPFCTPKGNDPTNSARVGLKFTPFQEDLGRFVLAIRNAKAKSYRVTWGDASGVFSRERLAKGINLAAEFPDNPFSSAFARADELVGVKQNYETQEVKMIFRDGSVRANPEWHVGGAERVRAVLSQSTRAAIVPVIHKLTLVPVP